MAGFPWRKPGDNQQRLCDRPVVLVLVVVIGEVPALDHGEWALGFVGRSPLDRMGCRAEGLEPAVRCRFVFRDLHTARHRYGFPQIALADHDGEAGRSLARPDSAAVFLIAAEDAAVLRRGGRVDADNLGGLRSRRAGCAEARSNQGHNDGRQSARHARNPFDDVVLRSRCWSLSACGSFNAFDRNA